MALKYKFSLVQTIWKSMHSFFMYTFFIIFLKIYYVLGLKKDFAPK